MVRLKGRQVFGNQVQPREVHRLPQGCIRVTEGIADSSTLSQGYIRGALQTGVRLDGGLGYGIQIQGTSSL